MRKHILLEIERNKKLVLNYANQLNNTQDIEMIDNLEDAIEGCFQLIANLNLRLASLPVEENVYH